MDTPQKPKATTPLSKFEESPVFNYINSLSPIKPVKSLNITQTFHSLSFSTLPSIFSSPHISSHHKETRFFKRHSNCPDPSRPESSSEKKRDGDEKIAVDASEPQENFNQVVFIGDASVDLPKASKYDCGSPDSQQNPQQHGASTDCMSEAVGASESVDHFTGEASQKCLGSYQPQQNKDGGECDWDSLIDAADLLMFNSPTVTEVLKAAQKPTRDRASGFSTSLTEVNDPNDSHNQPEMEGPSTQPGEALVTKEADSDSCMPSNSEKAHNEAASNLYRGLRRRCLDFEMVGMHRKNMTYQQMQAEENNAYEDKQLVPFNSTSDSPRCIVPGMGLHLNSLARSLSTNENMSSGISLRTSLDPFNSPIIGQELLESLNLATSDGNLDPSENNVNLAEDVSPASAYLVNEEFGLGSPKKKRLKVEGEAESCKRCNCKKSKCLKLYCECFAAGVYCIEPCSCQDCFNKPIHEDTVLSTRKQIESRNPLAFAPKVIRTSEPGAETGDEPMKTPASARHKRGCNCKKSSCLKKYCECYQGGVGCSINCRCEGCKNAFGRKDGSTLPETEAEQEEDTEASEKNRLETSTQQIDIQNSEEDQNHNHGLPATPLQICRSLVQLPFSSSAIKPPRSLLGISSTGLFPGQKYGKPSIIRSQSSKLEKRAFQSSGEDEMPEILRVGSFSPGMGIKMSSPNSKRVSPPHNNKNKMVSTTTSPGRKSGRKLILQSIPSFPSLTPPPLK
ncbi:Protein tesmin/TSO1-like CXC 2 [Linum grandiflorum]